jgi:GT2 family glycosyltransferase
VSVVIPTCNRADDLRRCLTALEGQTLAAERFEVIVVDDGSQDGTAGVLQDMQAHGRLRLRSFAQANRGPAAARNRGLKAAAPLVAFTDDDCVPEPDWLERLLEALPPDARCAGVGGRVVRRRDTRISRFIDAIGTLNPPLQDGRARYLVTANALYRRACLLEVGGFDEQFAWPGGEDRDLSDRLGERGYYHAFTESAAIRHNHRDSLAGLYATHRHYGRGERSRTRLGKTPARWYHAAPIFVCGCVGHWGRESLGYLVRGDLSLADRVSFCFYRLVCNAGAAVGFIRPWRSGAPR